MPRCLLSFPSNLFLPIPSLQPLVHLSNHQLSLAAMKLSNRFLVKPALFTLAVSGSAPFLLTANSNGAKELSIERQYDKLTGDLSIAVRDKDRTTLYGHSCSTVLDTFPDNPISFDVDQNGRGNLSICSSSFLVHEDVNLAGGLSCSRMHSPTKSWGVCAIPCVPDAPAVPSEQARAGCVLPYRPASAWPGSRGP